MNATRPGKLPGAELGQRIAHMGLHSPHWGRVSCNFGGGRGRRVTSRNARRAIVRHHLSNLMMSSMFYFLPLQGCHRLHHIMRCLHGSAIRTGALNRLGWGHRHLRRRRWGDAVQAATMQQNETLAVPCPRPCRMARFRATLHSPRNAMLGPVGGPHVCDEEWT